MHAIASAGMCAVLVACGGKPAEPEHCTCTPGNRGRVTAQGASAPMTGATLLAALRKHAQDVRLNRTPRDIKVADDQLRFQLIDFCSPCERWVDDRMTMEEMFPLDRLGEARDAVCMGLVLGDGSTVYGSTRPAACR